MALSHSPKEPPRHESSGGVTPRSHRRTIGVRDECIEGRFVHITTHQLCMAWWAHVEGHITRRQLRVWFAAWEMRERRSFARPSTRQQPLFRLRELQGLVGGRGSARAASELNADVKHLARLGLVRMRANRITFASSIEELRVGDIAGFWSMWERIPNKRRAVPVPRRTLRALAAGFGRAVTGVMIALMIRSLFWHRESGDFRVDGRTKGAWIAEVFGISRRGITEARRTLTELGWLAPIEATQWQLNRWGAHDRINTDWMPGAHDDGAPAAAVGEVEEARAMPTAGSASPRGVFSAGSASPDLDQTLPLKKGNQKTRTPGTDPDPAGVSLRFTSGGRKKKRCGSGPAEWGGQGAPRIRDIRSEDLSDVRRLLELYRQAVEAGLAKAGEGGRLDFLALAERARARGHRSGALLFWLLREGKTTFITQADEDEASRRLKEHLFGDLRPREQWGGDASMPPAPPLSDDERFVVACIRAAKAHRIEDPFTIARRAQGWTRERWEGAIAIGHAGRLLATGEA